MRDYRKLKVWEKGHELVKDIYRVSSQFPADEKYGITNQLRRAAVSVPTNIAEGCGQNSEAQLCRFLSIASGSLSECDYLLFLSSELGMISEPDYSNLSSNVISLSKMLRTFMERFSETQMPMAKSQERTGGAQ